VWPKASRTDGDREVLVYRHDVGGCSYSILTSSLPGIEEKPTYLVGDVKKLALGNPSRFSSQKVGPVDLIDRHCKGAMYNF